MSRASLSNNNVTSSLLSHLSEFSLQWASCSSNDTSLQDGIFPCPGPYYMSGQSATRSGTGSPAGDSVGASQGNSMNVANAASQLLTAFGGPPDISQSSSKVPRNRVQMAFYSNGRFHISREDCATSSSHASHHIIDLMTQHTDIVVSGDYFGIGKWNAAVFNVQNACLYVYLGRVTDAFALRIAKLVRARGSACSAKVEEYVMDDLAEDNDDEEHDDCNEDSRHYRLIVQLYGSDQKPSNAVPVPRCYMPPFGTSTPGTPAATNKFSRHRPRTQFALYNPSTCTFDIFPDILNTTQKMEISFGDSNDIPVPADYLGTGFSQLALYRPSTGEWFILHELNSYAECTIVKASYRASPKHDVPLPFFYRNRSLPAIWKPHEQNLFLCHSLRDWSLGTGGIIKCDTANWDDIPMVIPHTKQTSNICFAKSTGKWSFNQVREVEEYGVGSGSNNSRNSVSYEPEVGGEISPSSSPSQRSNTTVYRPPSPLRRTLETQRLSGGQGSLSPRASLSPKGSSINAQSSFTSEESVDLDQQEIKQQDICFIVHQASGDYLCSPDGLRLTLSKSKDVAKCQFEWIDRMYLKHVSSIKFITAKGSLLLLDDTKSDSFLLLGGSCLRHEDGLFCEVTAQNDFILGSNGSDFEFV
uniref:Uncharacterized protein n=1 Tax=Percolomonas cosmopolitus TaxID=63605 RepID=A0A7S1PJ19_9EUKA|mmetsp:Transcript_8330/g.30769  ORF Transcript_8330/g.30769 Transcript_8330/m.30769 type:complete len:642 (+) Transcript_8330:192-2117(+)|eukprot:CAMPEP_0117434838 /NCGR_PEP_ID=MMETSP0759-20121206/160_1 /TAXON_ID=63605 /ORGANISM="Percolomonas cosmopolitus, Strain WS" /LENGTH=641 /DNA_ID=CAMNT_0005226343 /DNA_START=186 /DNA_END=2111 /DNA_ORIENTATION=-